MPRKNMFLSVWAALSAATVFAANVEIESLPEPVFADRETSLDIALPGQAAGTEARLFKLRLSFDASLSNAVFTALTRDDPSAGFTFANTDMILGWQRNTWFLRPRGCTSQWDVAAGNTRNDGIPVRRTLTATMRLDDSGTVESVTFEDSVSGAVVFPGLTLSPPPDWLDPVHWTLLRAVARGTSSNASLKAFLTQDGAAVILK